MTKTQNSLLNTPLRLPVSFEDAPRNPIPEQEIPPLPMSRVPLQAQRTAQHPIPLQKEPLQSIETHPLEPQSLSRVHLQKQQVKLAPLPIEPLSLDALPFPAKSLPSFTSSNKPRRHHEGDLCGRKTKGPTRRNTSMITSALQTASKCAGDKMPLLAEQRLSLQGQGVALRPLTVATRPVKTRASRPRRKN